MAKFLRNLFSNHSAPLSADKKKVSKSKPELSSHEEGEPKEFSAPYDTRRKLSISRSGRMKQNLKQRGNLGKDLYGEEVRHEEKTRIEYHVHGKTFFQGQDSLGNGKVSKSMENLDNTRTNERSKENKNRTNLQHSQGDVESKKQNRKSYGDGHDPDELKDIDKEIENAFKCVETEF